MHNPAANRRRAMPGSSHILQQPMNQQSQQYQQMPDNTDFSNFDFNTLTSNQQYADPSLDPSNFAAYNVNGAQPQAFNNQPSQPAPSTELVRRFRNAQLTTQNGSGEQYNGTGGTSGSPEDEDDAELERRAEAAMREGLAKRKQIPPFVQKLSSFLDSNHTDLIRWSDDGRSFIVLDEDEFARTLIPELFKHNNYASFVRQLNMYGFHKTVNITDGSLRQSEKARKGMKPPSMYSHPYFRRNQPKLLWLINKPGGKSNAKRKRDGTLKDLDSDEERQFSPVPEGRIQEIGHSDHSFDVAQLPRNEMSAVRQELQKLQQQQTMISQMISSLKEQNEQFYRQARSFQALHDRHENSINAILTFLATFYNRSLEGQNAHDLVNMFTNAAQQQGHHQQQHGSVVEEYQDGTPDPQTNNQVQRYFKRPPLLLPGPAAVESPQNLQPGEVSTEPNSARASISPPVDGLKRGSTSSAQPQSATTGQSPRVKLETETPTNEDVMSFINSMNATTQADSSNAPTAPALDFNSIVDQYQNLGGNNPLTPQQRDSTLAAMMRNHGGNTNGENNALTHPAPPGFDLNHLKNQSNAIEQLQNLQKQNQESLQKLNERLSPHSPTGSIPGLHYDTGQDPFDFVGAPGEYDPNSFFNFDDNTFDNANGAGDFDFGFDTSAPGTDSLFGEGAGADDGEMFGVAGNGDAMIPNNGTAGRVESVSSEATSPANTVVGEEPGTPSKRQKRS